MATIADIAAWDHDEQPLLFVEVKAIVIDPPTLPEWADWLARHSRGFPFGMLVDPKRIHLFAMDSPPQTVLEMKTDEILGLYGLDLGAGFLSESYLTGLVSAWLEDFVRAWKHTPPPASEALARFDIPRRLDRGEVLQEVSLRGHSVR